MNRIENKLRSNNSHRRFRILDVNVFVEKSNYLGPDLTVSKF